MGRRLCFWFMWSLIDNLKGIGTYDRSGYAVAKEVHVLRQNVLFVDKAALQLPRIHVRVYDKSD